MSERKFDDFDGFASDYRAIHSANVQLSGADSFYFAEMKVALLQQFEKNEPLQILDVGCGDGATEIFISQYFPAWQVNAIDVSAESIKIAAGKNIPNTDFTLYDGKNIPLANKAVDIAFIAGVLHHVSFSLHACLVKEIARVLKPGGRLYLFEHNPNNPVTRYLVNTCVFDKDAKLLSSSYTQRLLASTGLKMRFTKFIIFFPRKGLLSKLIFIEKYLQWLPLGGQYFIKAVK